MISQAKLSRLIIKASAEEVSLKKEIINALSKPLNIGKSILSMEKKRMGVIAEARILQRANTMLSKFDVNESEIMLGIDLDDKTVELISEQNITE